MTRDYVQWHQHYDDPDSGLSWRLRRVQGYLRRALDERTGPVSVLSVCSGDGRDLLDVLAERDDAGRVSATLLELHRGLADEARTAAAAAGLQGIEVRVVDAGTTTSYVGAVPADIVVLVGIFGNITDADLETMIRTAPALCAPGATLVWSRGRHENDRNDLVRRWFAESGFTEIDQVAREDGSRPALGALRYDGPPVELPPDQHLFTFVR